MPKLPTLNYFKALQLSWKNKFKCAGRARRSEFWWNVLLLFGLFILGSILLSILCIAFSVFTKLIDLSEDYRDVKIWFGLELLLLLLITIYSYPLLVRRLHDVGKSGRWVIAQSLFGWTLPLSLSISYLLVEFVLEKGRFPFVRKGIQDFWDCLHAFLTYVSPFCAIIGIVLTIYLCVLCVRDSQKEENQYGPSPKYVEE